MDDIDFLIVGAGLAGLSCARSLVDAGKRVRVLERSGSVGGRCASRPPGAGSPVDFGPVFVHGDDPEFLGWIESLGEGLIPGWPRVVEGTGTPCQPQAFDPLQRRFALRTGLRGLAESLAPGLDVVTGVAVDRLAWSDAGIEAVCGDRRYAARHGVIATALEQTRGLLGTLNAGQTIPVVGSADVLLGQFSSLPCLTVLAEYGPEVVPPAWDVAYPEASALLLVSNEGTKRRNGENGGPQLVFQARPRWSAARLESDREAWSRELLGEAAVLWGDWAGRPIATQAHRWKYGRLSAADHLVRPMVLEKPGSRARWGLAGDLFDPDGGLQGAWRSGRRLAQRLLNA